MASDSNKVVVKTMAEEIVKAINTLVETNNKKYVRNEIKNYANNSGYNGSSSGGGALPGTINASQVRGLYNTVAGYIINAASASTQGDEIAGRIISTLTGIADVELRSAKINSAQIEDLSASIGNFIHLIATHATISDVDTEVIYSDIANIGLANIGTARINWASIDGLTAGVALFQEASGGRLAVDQLIVSDMLVKDTNGNMQRLTISDGEVVAQTVEFDGDDLLAIGSTSGDKLLDNTVAAAKIRIDDLFAANAFIANLSAAVITSPTEGETFGTLAEELSKIELTDRRLALILDDETTTSQIVLTPNMINAIAGSVRIDADNIIWSANTSIRSYVSGQLSGLSTQITQLNDAISLKASGSDLNDVEDRVSDLEVTAEGISSVVYDSETGVSIVSQNADKINWIVADNEETSEFELTNDALNAIAENINLQANDSVKVIVGELAEINELAESAKNYTDQLQSIYTFEEDGLRTQMYLSNGQKSKWSTKVAEDGFYIDHDDVLGHVGAFHEDTFEPRSIRMGELACKPTSGGGWAWKIQ